MRLERKTATEVILEQYTSSTGLHHDFVILDDLINEGGEKDMMGLYEVNIVDVKKNEEVAENVRVIARDEDKARMLALTDMGKSIDIDNCTFFVRCIGQWESKKPKEVKIVKEE